MVEQRGEKMMVELMGLKRTLKKKKLKRMKIRTIWSYLLFLNRF